MFVHDDTYPKIELESITTDAGRQYITPAGNKVDSVTTAIKKHFDQSFLIEWKKRVGETEANRISAQATRLGSSVHNLLESYLKNENIDTRKVPPNAIELYKVIRNIVDTSCTRVYKLEDTLYSDMYSLAGRVDFISDYKGELCVIDFKTSRREKKREHIETYFVQAAAYAFMFEEMYDTPIEKSCILMGVQETGKCLVFEDETYKYRKHDFFLRRINDDQDIPNLRIHPNQ